MILRIIHFGLRLSLIKKKRMVQYHPSIYSDDFVMNGDSANRTGNITAAGAQPDIIVVNPPKPRAYSNVYHPVGTRERE